MAFNYMIKNLILETSTHSFDAGPSSAPYSLTPATVNSATVLKLTNTSTDLYINFPNTSISDGQLMILFNDSIPLIKWSSTTHVYSSNTLVENANKAFIFNSNDGKWMEI